MKSRAFEADRFTAGIILLLLFTIITMSSCEEERWPEKAKPETSTMTDVEGNVYVTVKIGNQWWMAEDLRVATYRNGDPIPNVTDSSVWANRTEGAYCLYQGNTSAPGFLYNAYALANGNQLAPEGWRIPTDADWKQLERHLGLSAADASSWRGSDQGDKLKSLGTEAWTRYGDVWGNNESGFTAKAGGCRMPDGKWGDPGLFATGFWWSSTEKEPGMFWYRHLDYKRSDVFRYYGDDNYGFAIRCIKE